MCPLGVCHFRTIPQSVRHIPPICTDAVDSTLKVWKTAMGLKDNERRTASKFLNAFLRRHEQFPSSRTREPITRRRGKMYRKACCCWLLAFLLAAASFAFGQVTASSTLQGTVTDKTGAAVVGADVTVTNAATGVSRTVKTGADGAYRVDPLAVGFYNISVSMSGF